MARHKEFDKEEVLEKAMLTFWRYGFEGTSIQDLVKSMGINRGSLYDTFGDKRSLFLAALVRYENTVMKKMIAFLEVPEASKSAIVKLFYGTVNSTIEERELRGCFLTNTAIEMCPHDEEIVNNTTAYFKLLEEAIKKALVKAQEKGELSLTKDVDSIAQYLVSSLQGLRVMAKLNISPQSLFKIVEVTLSVLD